MPPRKKVRSNRLAEEPKAERAMDADVEMENPVGDDSDDEDGRADEVMFEVPKGPEVAVTLYDSPEALQYVFQLSEQVLSWWEGLLWTGEVLKRQPTSMQDSWAALYFVTYPQFPRSYDNWVDESWLLKNDDKAKAYQKELKKIQQSYLAGKSKAEQVRLRKLWVRQMQPIVKKRSYDKDGFFFHLTPFRKWVLHDRDAINVESKLIPLPRPATVRDILRCFRRKMRADPNSGCSDKDTAAVLKMFAVIFDQVFTTRLCYQHEWRQARGETAHQAPSAVFGAEHLLRLLSKWDRIINTLRRPSDLTSVDEAKEERIKNLGNRLIRYIEEKQAVLLPGDYIVPPQDYVNDMAHIEQTKRDFEDVKRERETLKANTL